MSISIWLYHLPDCVWRSMESEMLGAEDGGEGSRHQGELVHSAVGLYSTLSLLGAISSSYIPHTLLLFVIITLPGSWLLP